MLKLLQTFFTKLDKKNRSYVSDADQFIQRFDRENPKLSSSQRAEIEKHRAIFTRARDDRIKW